MFGWRGGRPAGWARITLFVAFGATDWSGVGWGRGDAFVDRVILRTGIRGSSRIGPKGRCIRGGFAARLADEHAVLHWKLVQRKSSQALGIYQQVGFKAQAEDILSKALRGG